jgi:RNA polymerase sigma-70 factor (ECF subfamily)
MESPRSEPDRLFAEFRRTGDPRALGEVYDRLAPELLRVALHTTRAAAEAEDVLQATFVVAIEEAGRFDPTRRVLPWLVGILANEAKKARERAARRPDPARLEPSGSAGPEEAAERAELLARLDAALERVPAAFRPVLRLRLRHGLTVTEIAAALERSPGTVRSQLARGIELLRHALPAGLAGALIAFATPARGLEAVRAAVVEHAALHGSLVAATAIGGTLAVKKLVAAALVAAAALCGWRLLRTPELADTAGAEAPVVAPLVAAAAPPLEPSATPESPAHESTAPGAEREAAPTFPAAPVVEPAAPASGELVVRARWPDGASAPGEIVLVTPSGARPDEALALATEVDGAARFHGLEPGNVYVRLLRGAEASARIAPGHEVELTLDLAPGVTVEGRVVDAHGAPVSQAEIWLSERYRNNLGHVVTRTDPRGAFTLRSVGPDHYLGARKRGFAPSGLRALRGASGDRVALELRLERAGASLDGQVLDPYGTPIRGACVLLGEEHPASERLADGAFAPSAPPQRARTDEDGRFELETAAPGPQPLQVRARGFAPLLTSLELFPGAPNASRISLVREARIVGTVRDAAGTPIASAWIHTGRPCGAGTRTARARSRSRASRRPRAATGSWSAARAGSRASASS